MTIFLLLMTNKNNIVESSIQERMKQLVDDIGTKNSFSKAIGVNPSVVGNIVGRRLSKPSFEVIEKIMQKFPDVNLEWLILGKGTMWKPAKPNAKKIQDQQSALINKTIKQKVKKQTAILEKLIESQKREINTLTNYIARLEKELQKYENPNNNKTDNS